jgi:uncharacterized protein involved in exopolysaccharide biosynthesis
MNREAAAHAGDELGLFEVLRLLWKGKWVLVLCTVATTIAAVAYLAVARDWFEADTALMQSEQKSLSGGLSQIGGLATLAGIRLPGESGSELPLAVLRSRDFADRFVASSDIPALLRFEGLLGPEAEGKASAERSRAEVTAYFRERMLTISENKKTGLVAVSIKWINPERAAEWSNNFVAMLNEQLRTQAIAEGERNVSYLRKVLSEATIPVMQQSIGRVLESEMQKLLLAQAHGEFAFKVVDRAVPPLERTSPRRLVILLLGFSVGLALGGAVVLASHLVMLRRRLAPVTGN